MHIGQNTRLQTLYESIIQTYSYSGGRIAQWIAFYLHTQGSNLGFPEAYSEKNCLDEKVDVARLINSAAA